MNKTIYIVNPIANNGCLPNSFQVFQSSPYFEPMSSTIELDRLSSENLISSLAKAIENELQSDKLNRLIAIGGDGTFNLVLNAINNYIENYNIKLGAVGLGSSNDLHKPLTEFILLGKNKVPARLNFEDATAHDIVIARFNGLQISYITNASLGITAYGNWLFNRRGKLLNFFYKLNINLAINLTALLALIKFKTFPIEYEIEGKKFKSMCTNIGVIKKNYFAGGLYYPSPAARDSQTIKLYHVGQLNFFRKIITLYEYSRGKFLTHPNAFHKELRELKISAKSDFALELDGEVFETNAVEFTIHKKRIMICP